MTEINKIWEETFFKHIALFSIVGILTIILNDYFAYIVGMEIPKWFISPQDTISSLAFPLGVLIFIFLYGYYYKYAGDLFKDDNCQIPEVSLNCFMVFAKMLPVMIFWNIYMFAGIFVGLGLFKLGTFASYIYFGLLGLIGIFVNLIYIQYSKDLKYNKKFYTINTLKNIILKTFLPVISATIQIIILFGITVYLFYQFYIHLSIIKNHGYYLGSILFGMCITTYIISLIHLLYVKKLVRIARDKLN